MPEARSTSPDQPPERPVNPQGEEDLRAQESAGGILSRDRPADSAEAVARIGRAPEENHLTLNRERGPAGDGPTGKTFGFLERVLTGA